MALSGSLRSPSCQPNKARICSLKRNTKHSNKNFHEGLHRDKKTFKQWKETSLKLARVSQYEKLQPIHASDAKIEL